MRLSYQSVSLPFVFPFTISKGTKTHQPSLIVELDFNGIKGYGEAPAITYYNISVEQMIATIEAKRPMIEKYALIDPERYWHYLHHLLPDNPFLVCALDIAAWDITGKLRQQPLYKLWNGEMNNAPLTDYTIGIDSIEKMTEKLLAKPWPIYKIKLGTKKDIAIIEALRKHTDAVFRVDANAGWTLSEALEIIPRLKELGVDLVEQPLAKDDWEGMQQLYKQSALPLIADESCVFEKDVEKCAGYFHGINIKLTKCSGITPARRMFQRARELGLKVMLGCMNESTIGSAAMAHLAPFVDYLDMDGPLLLAQDLATGITYDYGKFELSKEPGLGVQLI
ncbi:MAG: dipeptide epimerase [Bacteroidota bacterium]|nr:dipeptide epimerase [Bacteroidota bacterium]